MISNDFDVSPVFRDNEASLFAARRPDVWHFVLATTKKLAPNHQSMDIDQFHWPRYCVARALASGTASPVLWHRAAMRLCRS